MAEMLLRKITKILDHRDIKFDPETLKSAIANPSNFTSLQEWADEYLSPETLLTKDELRLFVFLANSTITLSRDKDLSLVLQLNDHEIQTAINELRKSTSMIEKQCKTLRMQKSALSGLSKNFKRANQVRCQAEKAQLRKWEVEKSCISASQISDLVQSLIYKSSDQVQYLKTADVNSKQAVSNVLQSDDRILSSFQKLLSNLDDNLPENQEKIERVKDLCARYIKLTVDGTRTKLDRIYLEALKYPPSLQGSLEDGQQARELQEELESLYSEIHPVAQISVEQQYLEPALQVTNNTNSTYYDRFYKAIQYIENSLSTLTDRIEAYSSRLHEYQCHRMAIKAILKIVKAELSYEEPKLSKAKPVGGCIQKIQLLTEDNNKEIMPEQLLAQNLGLVIPKSDSEEADVFEMENILSERMAKLESQEITLQKTMESFISSHLSDAHVTFDLLWNELLDKSTYQSVKLIDSELLKTVDFIETETFKYQEKLDAIDLYDLQANSNQRDYFLGRWSR
ncbi:hypothetical protein HI914_04985 [Erysiphe necator]|nr:hypothetical protein HI914_04985 [Erysiphe necator]